MADTAEYGLMLWDGKSKGTINNIVNLLRRQRPAVVYLAPTRNFDTVRTLEDLKGILAKGDHKCVDRLVNELHLDAEWPTGSVVRSGDDAVTLLQE